MNSNIDQAPAQQSLIALFDEGDAEGLRRITVECNIGLLPRPIHHLLQEILDYVHGVANAKLCETDISEPEGDLWFRFSPASSRALQGPELRASLDRWVVRAAFRDAMESVHMALESARLVLAIRQLQGKVRVKEFYDAVGAKSERFHTLPLLEKMAQLSKSYGVFLDPAWKDIILSLNNLRNCVVHRFGQVGPKDVGDQHYLEATWQAHRFVASSSGNERLLRVGDVIQGGELLVVQRGPGGRQFPIGTTIDLSLRDLHEICFTIHLFVRHVQQAVQSHVST